MSRANGGWKKSSKDSTSTTLPTETKRDADGFTKDAPTKRINRLDPISDALNVRNENYFVRMRWAWFFREEYGVNYPLEVDRYYPDRALAIDIEIQDEETSTMKRKLLSGHGIQYVKFQDLTSWKDLEAFREERKVQ